MKLPKKIAALLTVTLVTSSAGNLGYADTTKSVSEDKLVGAGRWETAIQVSKKGWTNSNEAIIVNDNAIADALAATPFADAKNAPILLTGKDKLDERTQTELKRLGVKKVYLIGGEDVLSTNIETELKSQNIEIDRIQGATRELTALEIANRLDKIKDISEIAVVNGTTGLADAVSIAAVAAREDMAIILSNPKEGTKASDEFIKKEEIKTSYVIGGPNAISKDVESKLPNVKRIEGIDRNETNAKVIETFYTEKELKNAYVAKDGMGKEDHLIDALAVGVLAAKNDSPVVIVGNKLNQMQKDVTNTKSFKTVTQIGGNGNENAFNELKTMQGVTTYNVTTVKELNEALAKADANDIINVKSLNDNSRNQNTEIKSENAITINIDSTSEKTLSIDIKNGTVKIYENQTIIYMESGELVIEGTVSTVSVVEGGDVTIINESTSKPNVTVAEGASVEVDGKFNNITVNGKDAEVSVGKDSTVNKIQVNSGASGTVIDNDGKVDKVVSNASDVTVENSGTVGGISGSNKPTVNGNAVKPPTTGGGSSGGGVTQNPTVNVTGVSITTDAILDTITIGSTIKLKSVVAPSNATNKNITWTSSDDKIATVNSKGEVNVVGPGDVTITATANNGVKGSYTFNVKESIKSIIDKAEEGTTIVLNSGTYDAGLIEIEKSINIIGKSTETTIINGSFEVNTNDYIENIKISNMTITNPSKHINLTSKSNVGNIEVSNNIFIHTNSSTITSGGSNSAPGTIYFCRNKDISQSTNESTSLNVLNNIFEYPNAVVGDRTFVGQVMDTDEVVFSNNVIDVNEGGDIRKGFELTGNYKGASTFTAEGNTFNNTSLPIGAWLYENNAKSTFNINNNKFNNSKTECIWIDPASTQDNGGNILGTLNAKGNIANNDVPVILISNGVKVVEGSEEGYYVSSDEFFENAGEATSGKYNVNGEVDVKNGHKFASNANVTYKGGTFDFTEKTTVNANNSNITFENAKIKCAKDQVYTGITHANQLTYVNCEIEGQFFAYSANTKFINCTFKTNDPENYNIWTYGSNVTFENCKFESAGKSVLVYNEGVDTKVDLKDCTFTASEDTAKKAAIEILGQFSQPTVTIENCTQTGFDTKGLWFVKDSTNKPIVEVDGHKQVNADEFFETAGAATSGKYEVNGDVVVKRGHKFASNANVTYRGGTFDFTEKAEVNANNSNITFENSKIKYAKDQVYTGITHANQLTYINCEIEGQFFAYSPNTKFVNCTFKTDDPENYNIWTYGSNVTFENCKFESAGKSVLVYNEGVDTKVDLKDCTFTASEDTAKKAAIEILGQFSQPTVTIENCTQTGFDTKGLWFVKDSTKEPVVKVDNQVQNY